jgi:hypothetical protein
VKFHLAPYAAFTVIALVITGCGSMSDILQSKNEGTVQVYAVKADRAWDLAVAALHWEGCDTIEEHRADGYMLTTTGPRLASGGSLVGVWIEPVNETQSKVTVVTKRKMQSNAAIGLTESTFHRRFAQGVEIVRSGKPLPTVAP